MFGRYLRRWSLVPDGSPITTPRARLLAVVQGGARLMLKISTEREERLGGALMQWWDGHGAARVMASDDQAVLLERGLGPVSLAEMSRMGLDDQACRIMCGTASQLHAPRPKPLPGLTPLSVWFEQLLATVSGAGGGILGRCAEAAGSLLREPREVGVLHGDLHHGNVLDFAERGWLAIDPKGLLGERGFDFAALFSNPDLTDLRQPVATDPARFVRCVAVVAGAARLERERLLNWILAQAGLSATWFLKEADPLATLPMRIAELAAAALDGNLG